MLNRDHRIISYSTLFNLTELNNEEISAAV